MPDLWPLTSDLWRWGGPTVWPEQHPEDPGVPAGWDLLLHHDHCLQHERKTVRTQRTTWYIRSPCLQIPVPRKLFGNYSTLLIKFRLQRYVIRITADREIVFPSWFPSDESVLPGLLHPQHPPGINELGIFLAGALCYTGQNHAW